MIDLEKFCRLRPHLYHLTSEVNYGGICEIRTIHCTSALLREYSEDPDYYSKIKRDTKLSLQTPHRELEIRDQQPLNEKLLERCVDGCTSEEYIRHLNDHVFFWAKEADLNSHYNRYHSERPIILCFSSELIFRENENPRFTHLNSGATRAIPYYADETFGGGAPPRGLNVFKSPEDFPYPESEVKEVTFSGHCVIPKTFQYAYHPYGPWHTVNLDL